MAMETPTAMAKLPASGSYVQLRPAPADGLTGITGVTAHLCTAWKRVGRKVAPNIKCELCERSTTFCNVLQHSVTFYKIL